MSRFEREPFGFGLVDNEKISFQNLFNEKIDTDVNDLESDAVYRRGAAAFPVFDCTKDEFLNNMESHRQRCRFNSEKIAKYMKETRYKSPFYIRYTDEDTNKSFLRKIK